LAPPFTLTRLPALFRALLGVALAATMVSMAPPIDLAFDLSAYDLVSAAVRELAMGLVFVLALQLTFGALYVAGRVLDIQAGFGLAAVLNPTTGDQDPLIGSLFVYAAAAVFFALGAHADLLRIIRASLDAVPIGAWRFPGSLAALTSFVSVVFFLAFGVAGGGILCLFLADLAIAMLSRTVPQMNVLILGLQVKTLLVLLVMPATFGVAGALLVRLAAVTLESIPRLL
jgi:flagellar biosynthetic protein FliR